MVLYLTQSRPHQSLKCPPAPQPQHTHTHGVYMHTPELVCEILRVIEE